MAGESYEGKLYNYGFWTEGQPHLNNRKLFFPRGKVLVGSSNINGMVFMLALVECLFEFGKKIMI